MAKSKGSGFQDPLGKWEASAKDLKEGIVDNVVGAQSEINMLATALQNPGLSRSERLVLQRELADAKAKLKEAQKTSKAVVSELVKSNRIQREAAASLAGIREAMKKNTFTDKEKEDIQDTKTLLEEIIGQADDIKKGMDKREELLSKFESIEDIIKELPDEVGSKVAKQTETLALIAKRQEEARQHLKDQKKAITDWMTDTFIKNPARRVGSAVMRGLDSIGIGALNLGNLARVGGGAAALAYRGSKHAYKAYDAYRIAKGADKDTKKLKEGMATPLNYTVGGAPQEDKQAKAMEEYVSNSKWFQRRLLSALSKGGKAGGADMLGMVRGLVPSLMAGISGLVGKFGLDKLGSLLGSFGGAMGKGALRMLSRFSGPLAAALLGWEAGQWAGGKLYEYIQEPLANTIDFFMMKDEKGRTGLSRLIDDLTAQAKKRFDEAVEWVKSAKDASINKAKEIGAGLKDKAVSMVNTGTSYAKSLVNSGTALASNAFDTAKSAVSSGVSSAVDTGSKLVSSGKQLVSDWMGKLFNKGGDVDVAGLDPKMQANMVNMAQEYYEKTGKKLPLNSAFRSIDKQAELYRTSPPGKAAPPGKSLHNFGLAFDTNSAVGTELDKMGLLKKYGFERPVPGEKWHVQPVGMSLSAARAGVYSADGPSNQASVAKGRPAAQSISAPRSRTTAVNDDGGSGTSAGKSSAGLSAPAGVSIKDVPTFESSGGMFIALNMGVIR